MVCNVAAIGEFVADSIRFVFERPYMYGSAAQIENTLRMYFRFASIVFGVEDRLDAALRVIAAAEAYHEGSFAEGYYREHPDANDSCARDFVLSRFQSLAMTVPLPLPDRSQALAPPQAAVHHGVVGVAASKPETRAASLIERWVRASLEHIASGPERARSAYDLEDDLNSLLWFWGILVGNADEMRRALKRLRAAYGADGTIAGQFFHEPPWATKAEAVRFVLRAYSSVFPPIVGCNSEDQA